jgi:hypothetical protein
MIDESLLEGGSVCLSLYLSFEKCHFLHGPILFPLLLREEVGCVGAGQGVASC